jgi:transcriptional regulator with XRE-family HTH domain
MTPLGHKLRALRAQRGVRLKDMAKALNVSSAYLSALEHGRRGTPTFTLLQRIIAYFNVIWDEAEELQRLAELSDPRVTIDTAGMAPEATELANRLARDIGRLGADDLAALNAELIKRTGRGEGASSRPKHQQWLTTSTPHPPFGHPAPARGEGHRGCG